VKRIVATDDGLALAEKVAKGLSIPFDKEAARIETRDLLDHYYRDISNVLSRETEGFVFENFSSTRVEAYSAYTIEEKPLIFFDQFLSSFFFGLNTLLCMATFHPQTPESLGELSNILHASLLTLTNPRGDQVAREKLKPLLLKHTDVLPVANTLTYSGIAHVICHEIAHHQLGHLESESLPDQELAADSLGYQYFLLLVENENTMSHLKIGHNAICAPLISLHFFDLLEDLRIVEMDNGIHPKAARRASMLAETFDEYASDEARRLYDGLVLGLRDLRYMLKKGGSF